MTTAASSLPMTSGRRVSPGTAVRNVLTLAWRNLVQIKHNPMELLDLSIQPIMFVLLFAYVFGPSIGGTVADYLPIVIPGIIAQNALFATMTTGFGLNVDVTKGVFDRLRSLPISRLAPLAGRMLADTVKQVWSLAVLLTVGMAIGFRIETGVPHLLGALALLLAFTSLFAWASVYIGLSVNEPEKVQIFGFTIIFPVTFLSSAFVPISPGAPQALQFVMRNNPMTHLVEAVRGLLVGSQSGGTVAEHAAIALGWGVLMAAIFVPLSLRAFRRRG
ncbi:MULTISPECIES: ABC transporter permease [Thermomonospora]|mgnify:CR=1 FL=1|uniref:Transport permease protein n=1 Tax=Thermomonospora curvata (strain ATCC 19995 / DSM 43183 / JCM 3096 / KCTC 9072 / NBRC 15933 / NCIMB 10081 / Henssen B9) TaxID=471852 RepID=D1ABZ2_THECD|nr:MULTISPECIES: ABC transporter permease [Thermomonospora]ACY97258.1 ABC-2 type transporter [Thermomonospora curvata DSM 43183]PKK14629.1 MAG: ABC transporter permease [Thermomonospora sp. CIF 1]